MHHMHHRQSSVSLSRFTAGAITAPRKLLISRFGLRWAHSCNKEELKEDGGGALLLDGTVKTRPGPQYRACRSIPIT